MRQSTTDLCFEAVESLTRTHRHIRICVADKKREKIIGVASKVVGSMSSSRLVVLFLGLESGQQVSTDTLVGREDRERELTVSLRKFA